MSASDDVRLAAVLAQCEMALVRRDAVAGPLLAQAARHAESMTGGPMAEAAARLVRTAGGVEEARKVAQALTRAAVIETESALLAGRS